MRSSVSSSYRGASGGRRRSTSSKASRSIAVKYRGRGRRLWCQASSPVDPAVRSANSAVQGGRGNIVRKLGLAESVRRADEQDPEAELEDQDPGAEQGNELQLREHGDEPTKELNDEEPDVEASGRD